MVTDSASRTTVPPAMRMSSSTTSMSVISAMLVRRQVSVVSSAATMAFGRAFLDPRMEMCPSTGTPPRTVMASEWVAAEDPGEADMTS